MTGGGPWPAASALSVAPPACGARDNLNFLFCFHPSPLPHRNASDVCMSHVVATPSNRPLLTVCALSLAGPLFATLSGAQALRETLACTVCRGARPRPSHPHSPTRPLPATHTLILASRHAFRGARLGHLRPTSRRQHSRLQRRWDIRPHGHAHVGRKSHLQEKLCTEALPRRERHPRICRSGAKGTRARVLTTAGESGGPRPFPGENWLRGADR